MTTTTTTTDHHQETTTMTTTDQTTECTEAECAELGYHVEDCAVFEPDPLAAGVAAVERALAEHQADANAAAIELEARIVRLAATYRLDTGTVIDHATGHRWPASYCQTGHAHSGRFDAAACNRLLARHELEAAR